MRKEIRRLEQLYREICELQSEEFERFKEALDSPNALDKVFVESVVVLLNRAYNAGLKDGKTV